jgi:hypothetical protein
MDDTLPTDKTSEEECTVHYYQSARPSWWNADHDDEGHNELFSTFLRLKYSPLRVTEARIRKMEEAGFPLMSEELKNTLDGPLTAVELRTTFRKRNTKKAPGRDGIGLSLLQTTWNTKRRLDRPLFTDVRPR